MTPVLSDIFGAVEDLETEQPGRFELIQLEIIPAFGVLIRFNKQYGLFEFAYTAGVLIGLVLGLKVIWTRCR
ncbi:hypothetical protein J3459_011868 [Metarhizium acridum]|nr:hypothetical protein J3459_011868 [Metarhizium acridum]